MANFPIFPLTVWLLLLSTGYYGDPTLDANSPCSKCQCDDAGSKSTICNVNNGQCQCQNNVVGRTCNECRPGYFNFPNCEPCQCNGHADSCHPETGICIDCQSYTHGDHCELCIEGEDTP